MSIQLHEIDFIRFRTLVEDRFRQGFSNEQTFENLREIYGSISPELGTIRNLRTQFEKEETIVTFGLRTGRLKIT
ncbi:MAG: hypothetical protein EZS28_042129, partial [Streblomastix strix]